MKLWRLAVLKARLRRGFRVPLTAIRLRVERDANAAERSALNHQVELRQVKFLIMQFPELAHFYHPAVESDAACCSAFLEFCFGCIPLIHEPARETQRRSLLVRMRDRVEHSDFRLFASVQIAHSDVRSGVPERALILRTRSREIRAGAEDLVRLENDLREADSNYESVVSVTQMLADPWPMTGDVRGRSLRTYFETIGEGLRGKDILHIAPEPELRQWFLALSERSSSRYVTLDAFQTGTDHQQDITSLSLADSLFDLVICHRVLEHVLDDRAAINEIYRILRPGGCLNVSVPQSMQLPVSNEWIVPDQSHHGHVRQYGRDFVDRLKDAGFSVSIIRTLLDRTREQHSAGGTYPMRIYSCVKG